MSYYHAVATLHRMRNEHRDDPDPKVQQILANFVVDLGTQRVADVLHSAGITWSWLDGIRRGRFLFNQAASGDEV